MARPGGFVLAAVKYCKVSVLIMEYPISVNNDGVNFKPEKMEQEKMYHCIFKDKAMLVFKDSQDVLNCYEVEDVELVDRIRKCGPDDDLEEIFHEYLTGHTNH